MFIPIGFASGLYDNDTGLVRFGWRDYIEQWRLSDTPAALMAGDEIPVYARYAETSDALRNAAKSGSEKKIRQARADFLDWMQAMEQTPHGGAAQ